MLSYFGTDQSQVQRYLSGKSLREMQLGMIFNGILKVPMQFFILFIGFKLGLDHIKVGWIFNSSSIKIPLFIIGEQSKPLKLAWMYMSLPIGIFLLILVNLELILIRVISICDPLLNIKPDPDKESLEV